MTSILLLARFARQVILENMARPEGLFGPVAACGPHPSGAAAARRSARLRRLSNRLFEVGGSNDLDSTFGAVCKTGDT